MILWEAAIISWSLFITLRAIIKITSRDLLDKTPFWWIITSFVLSIAAFSLSTVLTVMAIVNW